MDSRHLPGMSVVVSLTVLALFAIALIAGQARATLPHAALTPSALNLAISASAIVSRDELQHLEALPEFLEIVGSLPLGIDISMQDRPAGK